MADASGEHDELVYEAAGLPKTTNWWGAFVIGLAGTILVTGIAPVMVTQLGAASVPVIVLITISGYLVAQSFDTTPSPLVFLAKRALRIFPGLIVCVAVCAFVIGPLVTTLPLVDYFSFVSL